MIAHKGSEITSVRIIGAISHQKLVIRKDQAILVESAVGVSYGTENL